MTKLYLRTTEFQFLINQAAKQLGYTQDEIAKDYFMTTILKKIVTNNPKVVIKGGTSLSKCFNIIHRFSEDLDLGITLAQKNAMTKNVGCKYMYRSVESGLNASGFSYGPHPDGSGFLSERRAMNQFSINLPYHIQDAALKPTGKIEAEVFSPIFPVEKRSFQSYLGQYIVKYVQNGKQAVQEFSELSSFPILVQSPERTMIDKMFALADSKDRFDVSQDKKSSARSRDLYDIVLIQKYLEEQGYNFKELPDLIEKVKIVRQQSQKTACSAQPGVVPKEKLLGALQGSNLTRLNDDFIRNTLGLINVNSKMTFDSLVTSVVRIVNRPEWRAFATSNPSLTPENIVIRPQKANSKNPGLPKRFHKKHRQQHRSL